MAVIGKLADFSKYQGNVDWAKVATQIDCAIIRVQYGSTVIDSMYEEYVKGCKANNLPFGHYAYAKFVSVSDAEQEAKDFLARADKDAKFLVVDVEEVTTKNSADVVPATQAYIDYLRKNGVEKVGLYTGNAFYKEHGMDKVKADFLWIPRYGANDNGTLENSVKPDEAQDIWQYTQKGKLTGVSGYVDLDVVDGTKNLAWFIGEKVEAKPVVKAPAKKATPAPKAEPAKPAPKPVSVPSTQSYEIRMGDTLGSIALKFHTTVAELLKLNGMKNDTIYGGQKIKVPASKVAPKPAPKHEYHIVVSGDTVSELAKKYGSTIAEIQAWNKLDRNYAIKIKQKIRVK